MDTPATQDLEQSRPEHASRSWKRIFRGLAITAVTALVSVTAEALWKPAANFFVDSWSTSWFGDDWVGLYNEPNVPDNGTRPDDRADVASLEHHLTRDSWKIKKSANSVARASFKENGHAFQSIGYFRDGSLVLTLIGDQIGRGVIQLEKTQLDYYRGYLTVCDCTAPRQPAVMICPYVLYNPHDTLAASLAKEDSFLKQKCISKPVG